MAVPKWADPEWSARLQDSIDSEEGNRIDFKEKLPEQISDIGKHVAAFATSGGGVILFGVRDDGSICGIANTLQDRDELESRVQGAANAVRPAVHFKTVFAWAVSEACPVLVLEINDKQDEPVFYSKHIPYIRDGRSSRPAEPDEVKALVWSHPSSEAKREHEKTIQRILESGQKNHEEFLRTNRELDAAYIRKIIGE